MPPSEWKYDGDTSWFDYNYSMPRRLIHKVSDVDGTVSRSPIRTLMRKVDAPLVSLSLIPLLGLLAETKRLKKDLPHNEPVEIDISVAELGRRLAASERWVKAGLNGLQQLEHISRPPSRPRSKALLVMPTLLANDREEYRRVSGRDLWSGFFTVMPAPIRCAWLCTILRNPVDDVAKLREKIAATERKKTGRELSPEEIDRRIKVEYYDEDAATPRDLRLDLAMKRDNRGECQPLQRVVRAMLKTPPESYGMLPLLEQGHGDRRGRWFIPNAAFGYSLHWPNSRYPREVLRVRRALWPDYCREPGK